MLIPVHVKHESSGAVFIKCFVTMQHDDLTSNFLEMDLCFRIEIEYTFSYSIILTYWAFYRSHGDG